MAAGMKHEFTFTQIFQLPPTPTIYFFHLKTPPRPPNHPPTSTDPRRLVSYIMSSRPSFPCDLFYRAEWI